MTSLADSDLSELIKPFESHISEAILQAWNVWLATPLRTVFCNRTRANMVWDIATKALEETLDPLPNIHVNRSANTCIFMIGQQLAFRFKKADEKGVSSNYPTAMALAFHDPEQRVLGIPEAVKTEIIYVLNKLETEINHIKLVRRDGASVAWTHSVYERHTAPVISIAAAAQEKQTDQQKVVPKKRRASVKKELADKLASSLETGNKVTPST